MKNRQKQEIKKNCDLESKKKKFDPPCGPIELYNTLDYELDRFLKTFPLVNRAHTSYTGSLKKCYGKFEKMLIFFFLIFMLQKQGLSQRNWITWEIVKWSQLWGAQ